MPTILTHPAVLFYLRPAAGELPPFIYLVGAACSIFPDMDVLGFGWGIRYGDLLGHRGFSHSLFFAVVLSLGVTAYLAAKNLRYRTIRSKIFLVLFICTASHGVLDALTDGGLGVAFFSPFSNARYFFPWRPISVSPIGIVDFLYGEGLSAMKSEIVFIWLPGAIVFITGSLFHKLRRTQSQKPVALTDD